MDGNTRDKAGWMERIERHAAAWEALVAEAGDDRMNVPGAAGDWTFKDVLAHLNGWRTRTVARLEAAARGEEPAPPPWPADLDDDTDEGVEAINRWIYEQNQDRPAAEILSASREQFRRTRAAVAAIPEDELVTPARFPWLGGAPLCAVLDGSFEHLHEEHEPAIRAWLAATTR